MLGGGGGGGRAVTVTVVLAVALPLLPEHVNVYVEVEFKAPVLAEPDMGSTPLHAPDAVQELALVELQVKIAEEPAVRLVGEALSVTVGAAGGGGVP